jgi:hypothetical protein
MLIEIASRTRNVFPVTELRNMLANPRKFARASWPLEMTLKAAMAWLLPLRLFGFRNAPDAGLPTLSLPSWPFFITETETPASTRMKNGLTGPKNRP